MLNVMLYLQCYCVCIYECVCVCVGGCVCLCVGVCLQCIIIYFAMCPHQARTLVYFYQLSSGAGFRSSLQPS